MVILVVVLALVVVVTVVVDVDLTLTHQPCIYLVRAVRTRRKFLMQFPTSGRHRRLLAQAEMETGHWQAADKVGRPL